jgi:HAD superfamily hydrolase (TIGR01459 family)
MSNSSRPAGISGLSEIAGDYPFFLCDVWGVVHNGVHAHRTCVDALRRYRDDGGRVLLITNAPRPKEVVVGQLDRFGVDRDAYDDIITSGDVTRDFLAGTPGTKVFHLGPERDLPIYEGLSVSLVDKSEAGLISCTGLFDDTRETPEDYDACLSGFIARGLPMICANPDKVVERGDQLVWCAGALADRYQALGGETIIIGKPHAPIYEAALRRLGEIAGREIAREEVLAIGDGIGTDLRGAFEQAIDVLFVTDGIHAAEFGPREAPDEASVHRFLAAAGLGARNFIASVKW